MPYKALPARESCQQQLSSILLVSITGMLPDIQRGLKELVIGACDSVTKLVESRAWMVRQMLQWRRSIKAAPSTAVRDMRLLADTWRSIMIRVLLIYHMVGSV